MFLRKVHLKSRFFYNNQFIRSLNWNRIHEESSKTLVAMLYYIGAGMVILGAILFAHYVYKNQYYTTISNRAFAILGTGIMSVGTLGYLGHKLTWGGKTFTEFFSKGILSILYFSGTFCTPGI